MKRFDRGLPYEPTEVTIDTLETEVIGRFIGAQYTIRRPLNVLSHHTGRKK